MWALFALNLAPGIAAQRIGCNDSAITACRFQILAGTAPVRPPCDPGVEPQYLNTSEFPCCPSCILPPVPFCNASSQPRLCNAGELPQLDRASGCLTCRNFCTAERKGSCTQVPIFPTCFGNEPWYDSNCCPSCAPTSCSQNTTQDACIAALNDTLPVCPDGMDGRFVFDPATCCPICRKLPRATVPNACTAAEFASCLNMSRECASGEEPVLENSQCCLSCRRPERRRFCLPEDVGECLASRPPCAAGQVPLVIEGECCRSCYQPLSPLCFIGSGAKSCALSEKCLWAPGGYGCRYFTQVTMLIAPSGLLSPDVYQAHLYRLPLIQSDGAAGMLVDMVHRYCDRAEFNEICAAFQSAAVDGGVHAAYPTQLLTRSRSWFGVRINYPVVPDWKCNASVTNTQTTMRCDPNSPSVSFWTFLNWVFADLEATNGLQVTVAYGSAASLRPVACLLLLLGMLV